MGGGAGSDHPRDAADAVLTELSDDSARNLPSPTLNRISNASPRRYGKLWKFGNSNWTPTLQQRLDRETNRTSSTSELQSSESLSSQSSGAQAFGRAVPSLVFTSVEETRINQRS